MSDHSPLTRLPAVWKSLVLVFNATNQIVNERLAEELRLMGVNLSAREAWILMAAEDRPMNQTYIARVLNINANVMVRTVDRLEKKGALRRTPGKTRREHALEITAKGRALLKKLYAGQEAAATRIFHPVPMHDVRKAADLARRIIDDYYSKSEDGPTRRLTP
jgi:DNA-binding MarR family transcriptional regulator